MKVTADFAVCPGQDGFLSKGDSGWFSRCDLDDDGLPDVWEEFGADIDRDGTVDVPIHKMGADPYRKTIFVEVDWMPLLIPICLRRYSNTLQNSLTFKEI